MDNNYSDGPIHHWNAPNLQCHFPGLSVSHVDDVRKCLVFTVVPCPFLWVLSKHLHKVQVEQELISNNTRFTMLL